MFRVLSKTVSLIVLFASLSFSNPSVAAEALPSWNDSESRDAIVSFVEKTVTLGSPDYVPVAERIAVFDNDGTLWAEQPMYFQVIFIMDRIKEMAPQHPEWKTQEPFASVLKGDMAAALEGGTPAILEMAMVTHGGISAEEYAEVATQWANTARHPKTGKLYTEMVYQPMLEILGYLRANGYKTFIVSGGGIDFMRPWAERVYGIPPQQVIGSSVKAKYEVIDGVPTLVKLPEMNFVDDKEGKPVAIHQHIGRRPTMAFGNSDGDFQMLEWTTAGSGPRLSVYVHHTDSEREWAYDRDSHIGQLVRGLDEGPDRGWVIINMKDDWQTVFAD